MRQKIISLILVVVLTTMVLAGCYEDESDVSVSTSDMIKIGMTAYVDEGLFGVVIDYVESITDALGIELEIKIGAFSREEQIKAVEELIDAKCQGLLICNFGEDVLVDIAQMCDASNVYWAQYCRDVSSREINNVLDASEYYVGRCFEDDEAAGGLIADMLYRKGVTKAAIIAPHSGETTTDRTGKAFKNRAKEHNIELVAEVTSCEDFAECSAAVQTVVDSFPEVEGICCLSGATGKLEGVLDGLKKTNRLGDIVVGSKDTSETILEDIENGYVHLAFTGQYVSAGFALVLVLNEIYNTPLSKQPITLKTSYIVLDDKDDVKDYSQFVENQDSYIYAYSSEEIKQFIKYYNPDASLELLQEAIKNYSIDDVKMRHQIQ